MQYKLVALDQSLTATGVVQLTAYKDKNHSTKWYPCEVEQQRIIRTSDTGIYRLATVNMQLGALIGEINKHIQQGSWFTLAREDHRIKTVGNANGLHELNGTIDLMAFGNGFLEERRYLIIPIGFWKKVVFGRGNAPKDTAYLMNMNKWLHHNPFFKCSDEFSVQNDNIGDALCIGIVAYAMRRWLDGAEVPLTKELTKVFEKYADKVIEYGKHANQKAPS